MKASYMSAEATRLFSRAKRYDKMCIGGHTKPHHFLPHAKGAKGQRA